MPKLDVLISVKSNDSNLEYKTTAILTEEIIKYKSEDNTTEMFDYTNNKLIRENSELRMNYIFDLILPKLQLEFFHQFEFCLKIHHLCNR